MPLGVENRRCIQEIRRSKDNMRHNQRKQKPFLRLKKYFLLWDLSISLHFIFVDLLLDNKGERLPASIPLMVFARLHTPPPSGKIFQIKRTVTPPPPAATKVEVTQEPRTMSSPDSVTDI